MIQWFRSLQTEDLSRLIASLTGVAIVEYLLRLTVQGYWSEPSVLPAIGLSLSTLAVTATFYWVFAEQRSGRLPFASLKLIALMMAWLSVLQACVAFYQLQSQFSYFKAIGEVDPAPELLEFGLVLGLLVYALASVGFMLRVAGVLDRLSLRVLAVILLLPYLRAAIGPILIIGYLASVAANTSFDYAFSAWIINRFRVIEDMLDFVLAVVYVLFFWTLIRSPQPVAEPAEQEAVEA